jgi:hypothetical protein
MVQINLQTYRTMRLASSPRPACLFGEPSVEQIQPTGSGARRADGRSCAGTRDASSRAAGKTVICDAVQFGRGLCRRIDCCRTDAET